MNKVTTVKLAPSRIKPSLKDMETLSFYKSLLSVLEEIQGFEIRYNCIVVKNMNQLFGNISYAAKLYLVENGYAREIAQGVEDSETGLKFEINNLRALIYLLRLKISEMKDDIEERTKTRLISFIALLVGSFSALATIAQAIIMASPQ